MQNTSNMSHDAARAAECLADVVAIPNVEIEDESLCLGVRRRRVMGRDEADAIDGMTARAGGAS